MSEGKSGEEGAEHVSEAAASARWTTRSGGRFGEAAGRSPGSISVAVWCQRGGGAWPAACLLVPAEWLVHSGLSPVKVSLCSSLHGPFAVGAQPPYIHPTYCPLRDLIRLNEWPDRADGPPVWPLSHMQADTSAGRPVSPIARV